MDDNRRQQTDDNGRTTTRTTTDDNGRTTTDDDVEATAATARARDASSRALDIGMSYFHVVSFSFTILITIYSLDYATSSMDVNDG